MKRSIILLIVGLSLFTACKQDKKQQQATKVLIPLTETKIDVYDVEKLVNDPYNNPKLWINHLEDDLMKFWNNKTSLEKESVFFSTFRDNKGEIIPEDTAQWPEEYKLAMQQDDLRGLVEDATKYNYIRAHSRQTFAYGIAYNMTGNPQYMENCYNGAMAILKAIDENGGMFNKQTIKDGKWLDAANARNSQDLAYGMTGLGFYYYLTHDEKVLQPILQARKYIFDTYMDEDKGFLTWLPKYVTENNNNVEIVSQLDQLYAYMLWLTPALPEPYQSEWKVDLKKLANIMINHFYSERYGTFWGCATNDFARELGTDHTDFGHSVKAMWVIYEIGKIIDDIAYVNFAREKISIILFNAFIESNGSWARRYKADGTLDIDKEWWGLAELDQAAAILSLNDPSYLRYTNSTYKYWFEYMVDKENGEIWHMVDGKNHKPVLAYPKIHAWKTSLHSFEHCLLGYMISCFHHNEPFSLYYAFKPNIEKPLKTVYPYFFRANKSSISVKKNKITLSDEEIDIVEIKYNYLH